MKKLFITILVTLLPLIASGDVTINGINYYLYSSNYTAQVRDGNYSGDITIPTTVTYNGETYKVTEIGFQSFKDCNHMTSISLPNSVTKIDSYAFQYCAKLTSITLPSSVKIIGSQTFDGCTQLSQVVVLSETLPTMSSDSFSNYNITLKVPESALNSYQTTSPWNLFSVIQPLEIQTINVSTAGTLRDLIPEDEKCLIRELTVVGELNGYDLGFLCEMAGKSCYWGRGGKELYYNSALGKLSILNLSGTNIVAGGNYREDKWDTYEGDWDIKTLSSDNYLPSAFYGCTNLTSVAIPNSLTTIGISAFGGCSGLTSIDIPISVSSIESFAFDNTGWYNIQNDGVLYLGQWVIGYKGDKPIGEMYIVESTKGIADQAFILCSGLTSVTIPSSVKFIGKSAFYGCSGLTTIVSEIINPSEINDNVFNCSDKDIYATATLIVPKGTKDSYQATEGWKKFTNIVEVGQGGNVGQVFSDNGISYKIGENNTVSVMPKTEKYSGNIDIPSKVTYNDKTYSVTSIGMAAFSSSYRQISSVSIPSSISSIEYEAFSDCNISIHITDLEAWCKIAFSWQWQPYKYKIILNGNEIRNLIIPGSVTSINDYAFRNCLGISSVTIPKSVKSIGSSAFQNCSDLTSLTIGNSVTSIGDYAFYSCIGLTSICSLNRVPPACNSTYTFFKVDKEKCVVWVPKSCLAAYKNADVWKDFTNIRELALGDVNLDFEVNKEDLNATTSHIMGKDPEGFYDSLADLNGDEKVNAVDVVKLVDILNVQDGLSNDWQLSFNSSQVVSSLSCTLNNNSGKAIKLTKCELYYNQNLAGYATFNYTLASGDNKKCSFDDLASYAAKTGFSVIWYYTYNGDDYTYKSNLTE